MSTIAGNRDEQIAWEILRKQGILKQVLLEWLQVLELKFRVYRERQQLLVISDLMLSDIGITRTEADAEALSTDLPQQRIAALWKVS